MNFIDRGFIRFPCKRVVSGAHIAKKSKEPRDGFFCFPSFFLDEKEPWVSFAKPYEIPPKKRVSLRYTFNEAPFRKSFVTFQNSSLQKGVLYGFAPLEEQTDFSLEGNLLEGSSTAYSYQESGSGMIGKTPELLFRIEGKTLETMALAATAPISRPDSEFLKDKKEQEEHAFVVDSIQKALPGIVTLSKKEVVSFGSIKHIRTKIRIERSSPFDIMETLHALHPTAALGAYPKEGEGPFLKELNQEIPRMRYGAPFGYFEKGVATFFVAIRMIQYEKEQGAIWAGAGVTRKSTLENEISEVKRKIEATSQLFL